MTPATITQEGATGAPSTDTLRQLHEACQDAGHTYVVEAQRQLGRSWSAWIAPLHRPNLHPHRPGLTALRSACELAHAKYTEAWRAFHLRRGEG